MQGKTHIALGVAAAVALGYNPLGASVVASASLLAGAVLPDLDHRNGAALLRKPLPPILQTVLRAPAVIFSHRGPLHSLLVLPPLLLLGEYLLGFAPYGRLAALGVVVHLLADALTVSGVPLFWPLLKRRVGLPLFHTGGRLERAIIPGLVALWLWLGK